MPVMTRKAAAQDMELKLRTALEELRESKHLCQQMLQEREESEGEIENIVLKNTCLKRELVDLSQQYQDVADERDQLRVITDGFKNCSNLYEEALCKVRDLEDELAHANGLILKLQKEKECAQVRETTHLYNELVLHSNCNPPSLITIDLTEDSLLKHNNNLKFSQNKIKKYARLNKIIKKCNKFKKQQKHFSKNIQLRKERVTLINKLSNYQIKLEDSINIYEIDTQRLQSEIQNLEYKLKSLYSKYVSSKNQIKEHILATNELVDRVDLLTLSNTKCTCQKILQPVVTEDPSQAMGTQDCIPFQNISDIEQDSSQVVLSSNSSSSSTCSSKVCLQSIMFSDSIGRGLGKLVRNSLPFPSQNFCTPQSSYQRILASISENKYDMNSIITIIVGNSSNLTNDGITDSITELLKINCRKIILCAFPYFEHLSYRQNNYIHKLNMHMQFLVSHHSDKLLFFDINNFVDKLKSTRNTVYLPISFRRQIARLLAFNINSDIISMSKYSSISTTVSSSTNALVASSNNLN